MFSVATALVEMLLMRVHHFVSFRALLTVALAALLALPVAAAPPAEKVAQAKAAGADFASANVFSGAAALDADVTKSTSAYREVSSVLRDATLLTLDVEAVKALRQGGPKHLSLEVPFGATKSGQLRLELVIVRIGLGRARQHLEVRGERIDLDQLEPQLAALRRAEWHLQS
ncbi:MAG: hypothetical protein AAFY88_21140, partial [Acidobacteriota bacterium]